jgi:hypothetical protein
MIAEGADIKMHCMCFTWIGKVAELVPVGVFQPAFDKENIATNNLIENCSRDDIVVSTTHTNAVSRTKKGEPLKPINATCLQGFCINGKLLPTASIVKDHLQRWAIRHNKHCARQLTKQPLCKAIVQWKADHDKPVADGTVALLINPSTDLPLRFNMKRFVNIIFGHIMLSQLARHGRVLTTGDLEDGKKTDQDSFQFFLGEYNNKDNLSYSQHAFEQVDDFADAANFSPFPITEWENTRRRFGEMMADYKKLRNRRSGCHSNFAGRMAEEMQSLSTHTYPLMIYLHGFLEKDQSLLDTCLL